MRILVGLAALSLLAVPVQANLLDEVSGSFEDVDGVTGGAWPVDGNGLVWQSTKTGGVIERDSGIWGPGGPVCGDHYGSVQTGGNAPEYAWLSSITVPPSEVITLTGVVAGGSLSVATDIYIQILDGGDPGASPVIGEWTTTLNDTGMGWTPFSIQAHPQGGHATLKFGLRNYTGWSNGSAIHLDCLDLVPEPGSLALFGLAALPLFRRRR